MSEPKGLISCWPPVETEMTETERMTGALVLALSMTELTEEQYEHDHNYETGCRDYQVTKAKPVTDIADDLLAELERAGWKLVQVDPFAPDGPPPGCCGGWVGPNQRRVLCCPGTALPAPDVLTDRQGVLDAFAERLTKIEDRLDVLFEEDGRPRVDTLLDLLVQRVYGLDEQLDTWVP